jgi:multiple sugar transport system substrate-binding protein
METLRGVTWDHVRGFGPLEATALEYGRLRPEVSVIWERRSLQALADFPVERLAETYDLVMLDHPWVGAIASGDSLVALDSCMPEDFLDGLAEDAVGPSFRSYQYGDHLWALPVDAAAQVSAHSRDLAGELPTTWDDVLVFAEECARGSVGRVGMPLIPVDAFCAFATLCASHGEVPFAGPALGVSEETGHAVLDWMRRLVWLADERSLTWNPPTMLEEMSCYGQICYVPLLFGYSNYSREGFRPRLVDFADIPVTAAGGSPEGAIIGGVGLGISRRCQHLTAAADYAMYVASPAVQASTYFAAGGQPASAAAWADDGVNEQAGQFFRNTRLTLWAGQVRPRHAGFIKFQDECGRLVHECLVERSDVEKALTGINELWARRGTRSPNT